MKPLKLDADSSRTGKLEDMNAPWSRLLHLATRYTYPKRYPLVLAGDAMFDFYYLAKGRLRIMHGAENGRERAMVYIGSGNVFNEATALARIRRSRLPLLLYGRRGTVPLPRHAAP